MEYWNKLILELSTFELDSNLADAGPNVKTFKESVRAKKYSPHADPSYESSIKSLGHNVLAELVFLPKEQKNEAIALLEKHKKYIDDAILVWSKYYNLRQNTWGADKLIQELLNYFAINTNHIIWLFETDCSHDKMPLLEDLKNGFYRKYQTADWLIQQLRELLSSQKANNCNERKSTITQPQLALFYHYCHEKKCLPPFKAGQMEQEYKQATEPYGLAWKPFQQFYNRFNKSRKDRLAVENRHSLKAAMQLLSSYPEALELAKDELQMAETRNPIP
ncbi:hypothetical protein [Spirosoma areae]